MRRRVIQLFLPLLFCVLPGLGAFVIAAALPPVAREFYLAHLAPIDILILSLGGTLFAAQTVLAYQALRWKGLAFDERPDKWINNLAQAGEWFPLLGLIGTVAGILQTFSKVTADTPPEAIIQSYAPAITATGSGLFMALVNILPAWIVLVGRGLILALAGNGESSPDRLPTPAERSQGGGS